MTLTYAINGPLLPEELSEVFKRAGLKRPVDQLERLGRMIENADVIATARDNGRLVGVARAITDFSFCCYLSDLAVDNEYQKQGIGRELVEMVRTQIGEECMLLLLSVPDALDYYPRLGFQRLDNAFLIQRTR